MKEDIYLVVTRRGVEKMTKNMPGRLSQGEIPLKIVVVVDDKAFREPTLVREVHITDWREGIDIADVELREGFITEAEAEMIRGRRLAEMRRILEERGYKIEDPEQDAGEGGQE